MTKTLTEQWKDGELKDGLYYFKTQFDNVWVGFPVRKNMLMAIDNGLYDDSDKIEVLAPVPNYDEWHKVKDLGLYPDYADHIEKWEDCARLTKKLKIATKALNGIRDVWANNPSQFSYIARIANRKAKIALEEMEGVK